LRSFFHYVKSWRGEEAKTDKGRLADWIFDDLDFPKHSTDYDEISYYLEWNTPFPNALQVFDDLWTDYIEREDG